ncbi:MAG: 50S ribosomal protein L37ae [archaeon]
MAKKVTYGSVKRLGARYGRTVRFKLGKIESEQRKKHKCPYCGYIQVKRVSAGIWHCKKCGATFTNRAYSVQKVANIKSVLQEENAEITHSSDNEMSNVDGAGSDLQESE